MSLDYHQHRHNRIADLSSIRHPSSHITSKIQQVASLAAQDQYATSKNYKNLYNAEMGIYGALYNPLRNQYASKDTPVPPLQFAANDMANYDRETTFGPNRIQTKPKKNSQQATKRSVTPTPNPKDNIYKKSAIEDLKTDRNPYEQEISSPVLTSQKQQVFDSYMGMIEAIEAKAMQEIEFLRKDKINLMRQLNQQIRTHNTEKKLRMLLEQELRKFPNGNLAIEAAYARLDMHFHAEARNNEQGGKGGKRASSQLYEDYFQQENNSLAANAFIDKQQHKKSNTANISYNNIVCNNIKRRTSHEQQQGGLSRSQLIEQVQTLNAGIMQYEQEIHRLRQEGKDTQEAQALLNQGEAIKLETMRLIQKQQYSENKLGQGSKSRKEYLNKLNELEEENQRLKMSIANNYERQAHNYQRQQQSEPVVPERPIQSNNNVVNRTLGSHREKSEKISAPLSYKYGESSIRVSDDPLSKVKENPVSKAKDDPIQNIKENPLSKANENPLSKAKKSQKQGTVVSRFYSLKKDVGAEKEQKTAGRKVENSRKIVHFNPAESLLEVGEKIDDERRSSMARMQEFQQLLGDIKNAAK